MKSPHIAAFRCDRRAALLAAAAMVVLMPPSAAAPDATAPKAAGSVRPVTLEPIPGSKAKRVILSPKAAERLGIETGKVGEESIVHKQMVGGVVTAGPDKSPAVRPGRGAFGFASGARPGAAGVAPVVSGMPAGTGGVTASAQSPAPPASPGRADTPVVGDAWIQVSLSQAEWERLARDKPARLLPLATRDAIDGNLFARPSGLQPVEDPRRSMLSVYYVVPGTEHGLTLNSRMRVELQIAGTEDKRRVVPYGALHYDGKGDAWVYLNPAPLTFERRRVAVERVVGDLAVLSEGPAVGTDVVTVGAPLLFGAETFGK